VHTRPDALLGAGAGKSLQVAGLLVACLQGAVMQAFTSATARGTRYIRQGQVTGVTAEAAYF